MNFHVAAEEMRRLDGEPNEDEKLKLYGIYKQIIHGDIPSEKDYPKPSDIDQWNLRKYNAWIENKGQDRQQCEQKYIQIAEEMIKNIAGKLYAVNGTVKFGLLIINRHCTQLK
ncbi:Acyl-CoA-binding-like protein [Dirofilaria immitis]|nr:Acyl-CoA-binding-like protein [Dirofilaria immitis]